MRKRTLFTTALFACAACGARPGGVQAEGAGEGDGGAPVEPLQAETVAEAAGGVAGTLAGLAATLPPGWSYTIAQTDGPPGDLWSAKVTFENPALECVIRFGENGAESRTLHPRMELTFYRLEDAETLHASEEPFRLLSSHCPRDLLFAQTDEYFIALSPCDRVFAFDESCLLAAGRLEAAVRAFFDEASEPAGEPDACEQRLLCNAPTCHCPAGYRCSLECEDCRAECVYE